MSTQRKRTLTIYWPLLHGTISKAMAKCGQKNCRCRKDPKAMHGPYYRWTGRLNGKVTTKTISKDLAEECQKRIERYQQLQKDLDKLLQEASDSAPWNQSCKK